MAVTVLRGLGVRDSLDEAGQAGSAALPQGEGQLHWVPRIHTAGVGPAGGHAEGWAVSGASTGTLARPGPPPQTYRNGWSRSSSSPRAQLQAAAHSASTAAIPQHLQGAQGSAGTAVGTRDSAPNRGEPRDGRTRLTTPHPEPRRSPSTGQPV